MDPENLEPGNATDSESSEQSSSCSSSRTPSSRMENESIDSRRAKQKQQSDDAAATSSPNYMKTTTSYVAKKSSSSNSQRSGGGSLTRRGSFRKPAKGLARLSSSKFRMRKSFRRSRRVNSVSDDADWCSSDSEGGRSASGTKSVRTLVKVASLRIRRQSKSSVVKATCSSALKNSKGEGSHSNGSFSAAAAAAGMKVCPYSYCSLHGHHHSNSDEAPSLKRFVSMRRRMLQPKKKVNSSSEKASQQSSYSKRPKRSNKKNQGDQTKKGDVISQSCELGQAANGSRQDSCVKVKSGPLETDISNICEGHSQPQAGSREIKDLVTSPSDKEQNAEMEGRHFADHKPDGAHLSSEKSMEKNNYMGLWGLIYQHMVSGTAVTDGDESQQPEKLGEQHVEESSGMDQRADIEVDSHQDDAIKLVQEAFDNILLEIPDPLSDNQSVSSVDTASDELGDNKNNTSASMERVQQEQRKLEAEISNDSQGDKAEAKVGNKSGQKRLNGWSNLKKIMLMKRFVKAMEKVKNYNYTHKPRGQSIEQDEEAAEMVNLRPQSIGQKKNSEEWMLDYAIQKVISTMAPAQKRKVALIVQAFETVAPQGETGSHAASSTPKTPVQISRDISTQKSHEQEEEKARFGILLRKVSTGSKENRDQDAGACTVKQHIHVPCPEPAVDELASEAGNADLNSAGHDDTGDLIRVERESDGHIGPIGENPDEPGYQITKTHQEELILDDSFDNGTSEEITHENGDTRTATAAESPVGKQQHMKLWYLIYNHMVSGTTEPLQENGEEAEEGTPSGKEESRSQLEAIRLVEEAIDEIPLPETQDDVPASINPHVEEASTGCNKDRLEELNSSKTEVKPSCEEDGKEKEQAKPPLRKSWSNLKKVILLKRFIKSLEKVNDSCLTSSARKVIMPREPQFLAMEHEKEAEKVRLRNQEVGGRKSGDEWMLDYALRQVVAQLTPMRRRKVELLVEAFETVTPIGN